MKTIQIKCKAFSREHSKINKIQIDDSGVVRVWNSKAGHYTTGHLLKRDRCAVGKIEALMVENNMLRPISYIPPSVELY